MPPLSDDDQLLRQRILHLIDRDPVVQRVIQPRQPPWRARFRDAMVAGTKFVSYWLGIGRNNEAFLRLVRNIAQVIVPAGRH